MMAGKREQRIEELFQEAVKLAEPQREAFLREQCDDETRTEVKKLLEFDQVKGGGLTADLATNLMPTQGAPISPDCDDQPNTPSCATTGSINHGRFLPGTVLSDRYRIVGMLGKGGMGEVYRADDLELGQSVALKFLPQRLADDPRSLERFRAEVRLARQVSHPNVCRVYDIGQMDGQWYLSMEYVDGEDLAQLLTRIGRFNSERATELARQLCLGLHAAHEKGVLHRDLKPANVMIDGRGKLLITDFGLAELAEDVREEDIRSGTPAYMAPEQLAGREVTEKSDIYSLGTILHELYTGKTVWEANSMAELLEKRKSSSPGNPSSHIDDLNPLVERVIKRCLEPDPSMRPDSVIRVVASLPGGDPLQAALAAGQTPTPEMVADSGHEGRLSPAVGIGIFCCICVLAVSLPFLSDWLKKHEFGELRNNKPEVVEKIARDTAERLGYESSSADWTTRLRLDSEQRFEFIYRQSQHSLVPNIPPTWANSTAWQVTIDNPPLIQSGMMAMRLSSAGELVEFLAVPDESRPALATTPAQRNELFAALDLAPEDYELIEGSQTESLSLPPISMDDVSYWRSLDGNDEVMVLGAYCGRLTYLNRAPTGQSGDLATAFRGKFTIMYRNGVIPLAFFVVAFVLAIQNLSRARVDYTTAWRLAAISFTADLVVWVLLSRNVIDCFADGEIAASFVFRSFSMATRIWVYYVAFEPIIRRFWPDALVTWTRIAAGRYRDPMVSRDLMLGGLTGLAVASVVVNAGSTESVVIHFPSWPNNLIGTFAVAGYFASLQHVLLAGIGVLTWLLAIRAIVRNDWVSIVLFTVVLGYSANAVHPTSWLICLALAVMYIRMGLFASLAYLLVVFVVGQIPMTADVNSWYFGSTLLTLTLILLIAGYGLYFSTLHEKLWRLVPGSGVRR